MKEDLALFLGPSLPDYVDFVSQYRNESAILKNAENLKTCVDNKLTEEDKANVQSLVVSSLCVWIGACVPPCSPQLRDGVCALPQHCKFSVNPERCQEEEAGRTLTVQLSQARQDPQYPCSHDTTWPPSVFLDQPPESSYISAWHPFSSRDFYPNFLSLPPHPQTLIFFSCPLDLRGHCVESRSGTLSCRI